MIGTRSGGLGMRSLCLFLWVAVAILQAPPAFAERREPSAADSMRRAQLMIRKLSLEKEDLQAQNMALAKRLKDLEAASASLDAELKKLRGKLDGQQDRNRELVARIKEDADKYRELLDKYREVAELLRKAMSDNRLLVQAVQERERWVDQCRDQNEKMFQVNVELLERYRNKSVADVLEEKEPLFGFGRVELENQVQEYRFRLEDLQVTPFQSATPLNLSRRGGVYEGE